MQLFCNEGLMSKATAMLFLTNRFEKKELAQAISAQKKYKHLSHLKHTKTVDKASNCSKTCFNLEVPRHFQTKITIELFWSCKLLRLLLAVITRCRIWINVTNR